MLPLELDPGMEAARAGFATFAEREVAPHAAAWDHAAETPREAIDALAAAGYLGAVVGADHGGGGMDAVRFGLLNGELGRACSSLRSLLTVHSMLCHAVGRRGGDSLRARWLGRLARGEALGAFALSEPGAGSDPSALETVAEPVDGGYRLHGRKSWVTYGRIADVYLVFARAGGEPLALLVERDRPGVRVEPVEVTGTRASMVADVVLEGCTVPAENRVGGRGFGLAVALDALELGRYSVAWGCVGIVQACLDASLAFAAERVQYGSPIGEHQLVQRMLADMATELRAARLLCLSAGTLRDRGDADAGMECFVAKYFASTAATRAALAAVQIHGARGCTPAYPVERYLRDSRVMEIIEGSTQIQQLTIARHELRRSAGSVPPHPAREGSPADSHQETIR
jgi:glutaryl-CoA dehydrogenase (non-decarboxylating)